MGLIDQIKQKLGAGYRSSLFEISLIFPFGGDGELLTFLCNRAVLPESRPITPIEVPYQGDKMVLAGSKDAAPTPITLGFYNTEDFAIRNAFELWIENIVQDNTGLRTPPSIYKTDSLIVTALNYAKEPIKQVKFYGAFPTNLTAVDLDWAGGAEISQSDVTISYDRSEIIL